VGVQVTSTVVDAALNSLGNESLMADLFRS
jgi:hypothetical protein